jgi:hypothetical protein
LEWSRRSRGFLCRYAIKEELIEILMGKRKKEPKKCGTSLFSLLALILTSLIGISASSHRPIPNPLINAIGKSNPT